MQLTVRYLVVYLLPVGVVAYTMVGGLKATILTDWAHTFILLVVLIVFALTAYASHDVLGSPGAVYDLLVEAAARHPVAGNKDGSYLTMQSREGVIFFVINIVGELLPRPLSGVHDCRAGPMSTAMNVWMSA